MTVPERTDGADDLADGRYVYCLVEPEGEPPARLPVEGIDGESPRVLAAGGVAAVVHETDTLYDSDDPATIRRWLLAHHRVVEAATDRFGTPIPFQFDVVVQGGDETVRSVLESAADEIEAAVTDVAGRREYRIELLFEPDATVPDPEGDLAALREQTEAAGEGTAFLLEKKLERKRTELRRERAAALAADLEAAIDEVAVATASVDGDRLGLGDDDRETVTQIAVLADHDREDDLGARLDPIADRSGVAVRFTGPWAPYSFVPDIDLEGGR
ncbi:gas vesicle protein GvpL [Natrinema longum]|uniref:GvpL/GvpF family gas vesicle protein n=1 Tax=Natrinema longum TaxID=370324 RepID=A0A8A2U5Z1_9EURY|nr:GvpL/GvpF family gas vesicle protein [Natrinema longum]MBZ6494604.1 GvpL/GvpF family gas vesicle protein [Natrinema longum]QSW84077.1 GvpL/GvpF family gas vesicle protein [Natrinema longum]